MGLLAIHIILKAADEIWPKLNGRVKIYSDCLGALGRVADLPPHKIPSRCSHLDILKIILVNCTTLSFTLQYEHVKAHQDDNKDFSTRLGRFNHEGYKKWDWRWDEDKKRLLHYREGLMDVYRPSKVPKMLNVPNRWTRTRCGQKVEKCGQVCTVREVAMAVKPLGVPVYSK